MPCLDFDGDGFDYFGLFCGEEPSILDTPTNALSMAFLGFRAVDLALLGPGSPVLVGGAIGNVIDRIIYGAVADFLNMSCCGFNNPYAFNVADIAIFAGAIGLAFLGDDCKKAA